MLCCVNLFSVIGRLVLPVAPEMSRERILCDVIPVFQFTACLIPNSGWQVCAALRGELIIQMQL